tara:strand:+ start:1465 stop:2724 length:1260 start_codon:yes stop_codon:yes gene_type:complete
MKSKFERYFFYYLLVLFTFSIIFLYKKHSVGNDSTISEWIINYSGGFTKRGLIGEICIFFANFFKINLREIILIFQIIIIGVYFALLFKLLSNISINKLSILSIFTPIFILYPVAEIEVLARKEVFIFCIFILYLFIENIFLQRLYKILFLSIAVLIWEPVIFFFLFFMCIDIIKGRLDRLDKKFFYNLVCFFPAVFLALFIAFNPMTIENHDKMAIFLKTNFNESCYMSCALLKTKSSILDQFRGNYHKYSIEVFFRYSMIIIVGFAPLIILIKNSILNSQNLLFFRNFKNLFLPCIFMLSPVILLFAMGYDWGRWVNIGYVFTVCFYFYLLKTKKITLSEKFMKNKFYTILENKKIFIFILIVFCFGWNPKTVISADIATNPLWKIPYNASKEVFGFNSFRILQESPISKWHKKYIE